ncbi:hypothetical protein Ae201684P_020070 [Aphanomyces euteiches]|uniref:Helicase-associated domain-containing protein n=1 Tax=Aphanomyces euteiches TaxID=100861 RepID=A0A6G0XS95_9STRA|nr:hypothetical protein Ae201684_001808 [Aphanomyces euteiches]KAH9071811.1 hypothetical protein Ae201684P_020070 [Aphanomyces euteiches]KAH9134054.1 hypothetical protein AeRB84_020058 [Aphanomyces euteiches]
MLLRFGVQVARQRWTLRTISTWTPSISVQRQEDILRVAQCVHELEGRPERTNLSPNNFIVPEEEPFPEDLQGQRFDISVLRRAKQLGILDAKTVAEFDAIGFVWKGNEYQLNQQWEENIEALHIYKAIHGNLIVPNFYKVKEGDTQWPQKFWGKKLGYVVRAMRTRQDTMDPVRRDILNSMGFVWNTSRAKWERNLLALETYKVIYRNLLMKQSFVVPDQDPAWPKDTWNMKLGLLVYSCRRTKDDLPPEIYDALNAMGFVWKVRDKGTGPGQPPIFSMSKQYEILEILQAQQKLQGHTKFTTLPRTFKVPSSSEWPQHLHGCIVETSKFRKAYRMCLLDALVVDQLDKLGFVWNDNQHQWSLTMEALRTFKKIYGQVEVPHVFEVPEDDPEWPVHLWRMKLGGKVGSIRSRQTELTLEQRQELDALDFVWDSKKLRQNRILTTLKTYQMKYDNLFVPHKFVVPQDDPDWPSDLANMHLGAIVNRIRSRKDLLSVEMKAKLDELGFEWGGNERRK